MNASGQVCDANNVNCNLLLTIHLIKEQYCLKGKEKEYDLFSLCLPHIYLKPLYICKVDLLTIERKRKKKYPKL